MHVKPSDDARPTTGLALPFTVWDAADVCGVLKQTREQCLPLLGNWHAQQHIARITASRVADALPARTTCDPEGCKTDVGKACVLLLRGADSRRHMRFQRHALINDRCGAVALYGDHQAFSPQVMMPARIVSTALGRVQIFGALAASLVVERLVGSVDIALEQWKHSVCR